MENNKKIAQNYKVMKGQWTGGGMDKMEILMNTFK